MNFMEWSFGQWYWEQQVLGVAGKCTCFSEKHADVKIFIPS